MTNAGDDQTAIRPVAATGTSSVVITELRRGYGKWLALVLIVAGSIAASLRLRENSQDWPSAVVYLSNLGLVLGPLAIGVATFAGGRAHRRGTFWLEDTAPDGRRRAATAEAVAVTLWALLAYIVIALVCFVPTALQATWSGPDIPRVMASGGSVLALTVIGFFVGRLFPFALTAPFMAVAIFSITAVINTASNAQTLALYLPANLNGFDFYTQTDAAASFWEFAFYASCAFAVAAGWTALTSPRPWTAFFALGAIVMLSVSSIGLGTFKGQSNTSGVSIAFTCQGDAPVICTHPATRRAAASLRSRFSDVVALVQDTPFAVERAEQRPRGVGSEPSAGAVGFGLDNRTPAALTEARQELAHNAISQRSACTDEAGNPLPGTSSAGPTLNAALGDRIGFGRTGQRSKFDTNVRINDAISTIYSLSDSEFRAFLREHDQVIRMCRLTASIAAPS